MSNFYVTIIKWTDRVESDTLRVPLADVIDRFYTRNGYQRTTYSDPAKVTLRLSDLGHSN